jgi:hypothetical protein
VPQVSGGEYFACGALPAYGLFARNVHGLTLNNVRFAVASTDARPAVVFDHVIGAAITGLSAQGQPQEESLLRFINTRDVLLTAARVLAPAAVFLQVEGKENASIIVDGGDLTNAAKPLAFANGASEGAVRLRD